MREKVFRNSSGFRFNVSFVDCTSVFVKSVLETSLSFTYILGPRSKFSSGRAKEECVKENFFLGGGHLFFALLVVC